MRVLRQGDPLCSYLVLFCVERLSYKIKLSSLPSISISRRGSSISQLLFTDDAILFTRASCEEAEMIKQILQEYSLASGQKINLSKSSLDFSNNTSRSIRSSISKILHIDNITNLNIFLSILADFPRSKRHNFAYIQDRIQKKILGWHDHLLSLGEGSALEVYCHYHTHICYDLLLSPQAFLEGH